MLATQTDIQRDTVRYGSPYRDQFSGKGCFRDTHSGQYSETYGEIYILGKSSEIDDREVNSGEPSEKELLN